VRILMTRSGRTGRGTSPPVYATGKRIRYPVSATPHGNLSAFGVNVPIALQRSIAHTTEAAALLGPPICA
jgi:hypothetical protein